MCAAVSAERRGGGLIGIISRIAGIVVVFVLLSTAVLAVRGAMRERRERAEGAWREARMCALSCASKSSDARAKDLQQCRETARSAAEFSMEMPELDGHQLELRAALDELVQAIEAGDQHRLSSAIERSTRAGSALGWSALQPSLH